MEGMEHFNEKPAGNKNESPFSDVEDSSKTNAEGAVLYEEESAQFSEGGYTVSPESMAGIQSQENLELGESDAEYISEEPTLGEREADAITDVLGEDVRKFVESETNLRGERAAGENNSETGDAEMVSRVQESGVLRNIAEKKGFMGTLKGIMMASIFAGVLSAGMAPKEAEAGDLYRVKIENPYHTKAQREVYKNEYGKAREREQKRLERQQTREAKREARQDARGDVIRKENRRILKEDIKVQAKVAVVRAILGTILNF